MNAKPATEQKSSAKTYLSDLAKAELKNLLKLGLSLEWEDIVRINCLSLAVENPTFPSPAATGRPIEVRGRFFWPFTIQSAEWYAFAIDAVSEELSIPAILYAFEHSFDGDFIPLYDIHKATAELSSYRKGLNFTLNECVEIVAKVMPEPSAETAEDSDNDFDQLVAFLEVKTGLPADHWTSRVSLDHAVRAVEVINQENEKESVSSKMQSYIRAEGALHTALKEIRSRV